MIISYIAGGIGNQLFQYAAGRRLAHKWNTELKLDLDPFYIGRTTHPYYGLDQFNITATIATPEEVAALKKFSNDNALGVENIDQKFMPEVLDYPDNVYLEGDWINQRYFADIADIIRWEFTLKNPSSVALYWQEKILSAECSVSMHMRHGDFLYNPINYKEIWRKVPLDYYRDALNTLRYRYGYKNPSVFVFSDNLPWVKENLRLDVPTEFIEGCSHDAEEIWLMSLCRHNILKQGSTFSRWGAWLNTNPDKKIFCDIPARTEEVSRYRSESTLPTTISDRIGEVLKIPFDSEKPFEVTIRPYFSLLMVVNDDAATLRESLENILAQDYKFYELIIVDNSSTDGSRKICRQAAQASENVTLIKLYDRVQDGAAWNKALDVAQGKFVMFLRGSDRLFPDALTNLYLINEKILADIINSVAWIREDKRNDISVEGKNFYMETEPFFSHLKNISRGKLNKMTILKIFSVNDTVAPIGSKVFKRKFLSDNTIHFDEEFSGGDAELFFTVEAMLKADEMLFTPNPFFIAPNNK